MTIAQIVIMTTALALVIIYEAKTRADNNKKADIFEFQMLKQYECILNFLKETVDSDAAGTTSKNSATMSHYLGQYMRGYKFGAYRTICWTPTQIKSCTDGFKTYAAGKGLTVEYCDPYTYLNMLKAAGNAQVVG